MKTKTVLVIICMITLIGYPIYGRGVAPKDGFSISVVSNKISVTPGHQQTIELELVRSKRYLNRSLQVSLEQVPSGIRAHVDQSEIRGDDIKIFLLAEKGTPSGKHMIVCAIKDKYKKKSIVLTIYVNDDQP